MIIGNVGQDPKFTSTTNGTPVCTFSLATNRTWYSGASDEKREETSWHNIVAFSDLAQICEKILAKGTKTYVLGRLQNREFTDSEGNRVNKTEIVALDIIALEKRKDSNLNDSQEKI
jgi:single-strand DNA-binding protein